MFKKSISKIALVALALCFSNAALAGLHVEPFLGYSLSGDYDAGGGNDGDYTSDGPQLGLRVGYGMLGFFGAFEYEMSPMTAEPDSGSSTGIDQTNLGFSVGYEFPILVRAYATYIFSATGEADSTGDPEYSGTGTKIGVGFTGLPFIAINLEMTQITYDEVDPGTLANDFEATYYTINVSAPFNF